MDSDITESGLTLSTHIASTIVYDLLDETL